VHFEGIAVRAQDFTGIIGFEGGYVHGAWRVECGEDLTVANETMIIRLDVSVAADDCSSVVDALRPGANGGRRVLFRNRPLVVDEAMRNFSNRSAA
jgi:hypothetical protein